MAELKNKLQQVMDEMGTPTLKAIAFVFGLPAPRIYSVAKQPREGEVYDAKSYNWDAIERFIARRLDPDTELATLEDVVAKALEADKEFHLQDGRRTANRESSNKKIEVDGKMIPVRKFSNFEMENGMLVCLKKETAVYKIVYQTVSHTVLVPVKNYEGEITSQEVKVISNLMLNMKGVGPGALDECIAKRFEAMATAEAAE